MLLYTYPISTSYYLLKNIYYLYYIVNQNKKYIKDKCILY